MRKINLLLSSLLFTLSSLIAQNASTGLKSSVVDETNRPVSFANVTLFQTSDSTMAKAGYSKDDGSILFTHILPGSYYMNISFVGYDTYVSSPFEITDNNISEFEQVKLTPASLELDEVVVAATKPIVEVKPDKTVFNVEGSINAIGNNAIELLRKAP